MEDNEGIWLPIEIWDNILSYCEYETLEVLRLVSRLFANLLSVNQTIWQKRCEVEYGFVRSEYWKKVCGGKLHLPILTILDIPQYILERQGMINDKKEYEFEKERTWIRRKKCKNYFNLYCWFKKEGKKRETQISRDDCINPFAKDTPWSDKMEGNKDYFAEMHPWLFDSATNYLCCWPSVHTHFACNTTCYSETKYMNNNNNINNDNNNINNDNHHHRHNGDSGDSGDNDNNDDDDDDDEFERPAVKLQIVTMESASTLLSRLRDRHPIPFTNRYISYFLKGSGCILFSDTVEFHTMGRKKEKEGEEEWIRLDDYIFRYWDMLLAKGEVNNNNEISREDEEFYRDILIRYAEIMVLVCEILYNILYYYCQSTNSNNYHYPFSFSTSVLNQKKKQLYFENMGQDHYCSCITSCTHNISPYYLVFSADPFDKQIRDFDYTLTPLRCSAILGRLLRVMLQGEYAPMAPLRALFWAHFPTQPADDEKFRLFPQSETLNMFDQLSRRLLGEPSLRPSVLEVKQFFISFLEENLR